MFVIFFQENKEFTVGSTEIVPLCRQPDFEIAYKGTPLRMDEDKGAMLDNDHKSDQVKQLFTPLSLFRRKQCILLLYCCF